MWSWSEKNGRTLQEQSFLDSELRERSHHVSSVEMELQRAAPPEF
jgi:hypothetical protein